MLTRRHFLHLSALTAAGYAIAAEPMNYARGQSAALSERVGVTGFCWGGSTTMQYAAYDRNVGAAVAWYGPPGRG